MLEVDVRSGDVPSARVTILNGWVEREYKECFAWYANGLVYIRHYQDHPNAIPRAVFSVDAVFVEHFGPHPVHQPRQAPRPQQPQERSAQPTGQVVNLPVKQTAAVASGGPEAAQQLKEGRTPEQILADLEKFPSAAEQKGTREYLESSTAAADPKEVSEPSTEEESGSAPPLLETPSGKFMTRPLPEEQPKVELAKEHSYGTAISSTVIEPTAISKSSRTGGRKRRGNHGRPRQLPGAMALLAVALFLSLSFRRSF